VESRTHQGQPSALLRLFDHPGRASEGLARAATT
jgi:hypothetical protein